MTGIYYSSIRDASKSYIYSSDYLRQMLVGRKKNKTSFIYA